MTLCIACEKPVKVNDFISFVNPKNEEVNYHRQCYADKFKAPHALLNESGVAHSAHPNRD